MELERMALGAADAAATLAPTTRSSRLGRNATFKRHVPRRSKFPLTLVVQVPRSILVSEAAAWVVHEPLVGRQRRCYYSHVLGVGTTVQSA